MNLLRLSIFPSLGLSLTVFIALIGILLAFGANFYWGPYLNNEWGFVGNLISTFVGVLLGLPLAIEIEHRNELRRSAKDQEDAERKQRELNKLLNDEVSYNLHEINHRVLRQKQDPRACPQPNLKFTLWEALCDSGDTRYLQLEVLRVLSEVHFLLKLVHFYEERAYLAATGLNPRFDNGMTSAEYILGDARARYSDLQQHLSLAQRILSEALSKKGV
jgi:hypothetical protein